MVLKIKGKEFLQNTFLFLNLKHMNKIKKPDEFRLEQLDSCDLPYGTLRRPQATSLCCFWSPCHLGISFIPQFLPLKMGKNTKSLLLSVFFSFRILKKIRCSLNSSHIQNLFPGRLVSYLKEFDDFDSAWVLNCQGAECHSIPCN